MFHAVRSWWTGGRGKVSLRLFLFEFLVVVAGVLAAQALANWVSARAESFAGERLLSDAIERSRELDRSFAYWQRFAPCLRGHTAAIGRAAADGKSMSSDAIGRPAFPGMIEPQFDADDWRKIALVATPEQVEALRVLQATTSVYKTYVSEMAMQWATFRLLDPGFGNASAEDRSRVRAAATGVDNALRWMMYRRLRNPGDFLPLGLGSTPIDADLRERVDECGLLKDWR
jgi:hypothetical protein